MLDAVGNKRGGMARVAETALADRYVPPVYS
jgi:hypothetical protein